MKNKGAKFDLLVLECPVSYMLWFEYIYIKCNNCFLFIRPWVPSDGNHNDKLTNAVLNKKNTDKTSNSYNSLRLYGLPYETQTNPYA